MIVMWRNSPEWDNACREEKASRTSPNRKKTRVKRLLAWEGYVCEDAGWIVVGARSKGVYHHSARRDDGADIHHMVDES